MSLKINTSLYFPNRYVLVMNKESTSQNIITFKSDFNEARKRIYLGQPLGEVTSNGLVNVSDDLLVPIVPISTGYVSSQASLLPSTKMQANDSLINSLTPKEVQTCYDRFNELEGKGKHLWEKVKSTAENPKGAVCGFILGTCGDSVLSIQSTIKNKIETIVSAVNEKIENASLDSLKDIESKIRNVAQAQQSDSENVDNALNTQSQEENVQDITEGDTIITDNDTVCGGQLISDAESDDVENSEDFSDEVVDDNFELDLNADFDLDF